MSVSGQITNNIHIGGIVGSATNCIIKNCKSEMLFDVDNAYRIGGIVAYANNSNIINCQNYGKINSKICTYTGGIVAQASASSIKNCVNNEKITIEKGTYVGGIAGYTNNTDLSESSNKAEIITTNVSSIGGIIGYGYAESYTTSTVKNNYNEANITSNGTVDFAGGIIGVKYFVVVENCYNKSNMNIATTSDDAKIGGIVGKALEKGIICNSYNIGEITVISDNKLCCGGICGEQKYGIIGYCYNMGNLKCSAKGENRIGGIIGIYNGGYLLGVYNTGNIKISDDNEGTLILGGIIGTCYYMNRAFNAYNFGQIISLQTSNNIGGTFGIRHTTENSTVTDFYYKNSTYSGGTYFDSNVAQGVDDININDMMNDLNAKRDDFQSILGDFTPSVLLNSWKIDESKNEGYPIFEWQ